jgi:hypothetical protein
MSLHGMQASHGSLVLFSSFEKRLIAYAIIAVSTRA